jgi:hypothetical protein
MASTARASSTRAALSAAAQEYVLSFRSHHDVGGVTPTLVAKDLEVSKQAAAEMFKRLADDKLIASCTGHARLWKLTAAGEAAADAIFKRHALPHLRSVSMRCSDTPRPVRTAIRSIEQLRRADRKGGHSRNWRQGSRQPSIE